MIEAIAELFVERVPRTLDRPVLAQASRLLVVDACGRLRRIADLTALVERAAPVTASYVRLDGVGLAPIDAEFESVWLFVDDQSDLNYCGLYTRELGERFQGARLETVGVGEVDESKCSILLMASAAGAAPSWRRRRELARGADQLIDQLLSPRTQPS
ncbi:MAG: hypothetical protein HYX29_05260 [Solirubrobacterales bacterium]|nr:hypothetical protein [Solirubrobacterales bacterium]